MFKNIGSVKTFSMVLIPDNNTYIMMIKSHSVTIDCSYTNIIL